MHRVNKTGRTLRTRVAGGSKLYFGVALIPVPIGRVGVRFDAIASNVEPDWRIEGDMLAH